MKKIKFLSDIEVAGAMTVGESKAEILTKDDLATPDWNQVDSTAPDFIKNKTHYEICTRKALSGKPSASKYIDIETTGGFESRRFYTLAEDFTPDNFNFTAAKLNNYTIRPNDYSSYNEVAKADGEELVFEKDLFRIANSEISDKYCVYEYRLNDQWSYPNFAIIILFVKEACQVSFRGYCSSDDKDLSAYISKPGIYISAVDNFYYEVKGSHIELTGDIYGNACEITPLNWKYLPSDVASTDQITNISDQITSVSNQLSYKAPTSHASSSTTYGVSTAYSYGHAKASSTTPAAPGTAYVGSQTSSFARGDHRHPLQTSVTGSAGSATKDSAGNIIKDTYAKKTELADFITEEKVTSLVSDYVNEHVSAEGNISVSANWNQNNPNASDYIKNRTHYSNIVSDTYSGTTNDTQVSVQLECSGYYGPGDHGGYLRRIADASTTGISFDSILVETSFDYFNSDYDWETVTVQHSLYQDIFKAEKHGNNTIYSYTILDTEKIPEGYSNIAEWYHQGKTIFVVNAQSGLWAEVNEHDGSSGFQYHFLSIDQPGIYITEGTTINNLTYTRQDLKKLDEIYLPNTVAKKTDISTLTDKYSELNTQVTSLQETLDTMADNTGAVLTLSAQDIKADASEISLTSDYGNGSVNLKKAYSGIIETFDHIKLKVYEYTDDYGTRIEKQITLPKDVLNIQFFGGNKCWVIDCSAIIYGSAWTWEYELLDYGANEILIYIPKSGYYEVPVDIYGGSSNIFSFYAPEGGLYMHSNASIELCETVAKASVEEQLLPESVMLKTEFKQPDWNSVDDSSKSFIKNKPFGEYLIDEAAWVAPKAVANRQTSIMKDWDWDNKTLLYGFYGKDIQLPDSFKLTNGTIVPLDSCERIANRNYPWDLYFYNNEIVALVKTDLTFDSQLWDVYWPYLNYEDDPYGTETYYSWQGSCNNKSRNTAFWLNNNFTYCLPTRGTAIKTLEEQYIPTSIARTDDVEDLIESLQQQINELKEQLSALANK